MNHCSVFLTAALLGGLAATGFGAALASSADDMEFLGKLAAEVVEASRVKPGQKIGSQPANSLGYTLIKPGGGGSYPSFWIRDFAMSVESGYITAEEVRNHLGLIARCQNGPTERKLLNNLALPPYAIPDHINFEGKPIFYPGTYSPGNDQGSGGWGFLPPVDDHYEFIHIAWHLFRTTGSSAFLRDTLNGMPLRERLTGAFDSPRTDSLTGLVVTDSARRAVGFGFCDAIYMTGKLLFPSLLRYRAAGQLAELLAAEPQPDRAAHYRRIQQSIRSNVVPAFAAPGRIRGWLMAATGVGRQPDVWGSLYALHLGVLPAAARDTLIGTVVDAVRRGTIAYQGAVRHVPTDFDASPVSAWERTHVKLNVYQNGAFWHTPTGWLIKALRPADAAAASRLFADYLLHLRQGDFRLGGNAKAPWECFGRDGYTQNGIYMTSVTLPLAVLTSTPVHLADQGRLRLPGKSAWHRASLVRGKPHYAAPDREGRFLAVFGLDGRLIGQRHLTAR